MAASRLGFGVSGPLGQKWFSERKTSALIEDALAGGIAHFDAAPFYFDAEERVGATLAALGARHVFVSTKTGTRRRGAKLVKDFSERAIRDDVDQSRARLRRDRIDLLYLHGPTLAQINESLPILDTLKREGKIARAGVCGEGEQLARAVETGFDSIMGVYNVLDRRHEAIFHAAKAKGMMKVAIAPLAQGLFDPRFLAPSSPSNVWRLLRASLRGRYPAAAVRAAKEALGADPVGTGLRFVLANPDIDIVMTTTTKSGHLAQSIAAAKAPIDPGVYADLKALSLDPPSRGA